MHGRGGGRARTVISEEIRAARQCSCSWNKNEGKKDKVYKSLSHIHRREQEQALLWGQRTFYKFHISGNVRVVCKQNCRKKDQVENPPHPKEKGSNLS